jgi:hypothetical protein
VEPAIAVMTEAFADYHGNYSAPDQWRHWLTAKSILPDANHRHLSRASTSLTVA